MTAPTPPDPSPLFGLFGDAQLHMEADGFVTHVDGTVCGDGCTSAVHAAGGAR